MDQENTEKLNNFLFEKGLTAYLNYAGVRMNFMPKLSEKRFKFEKIKKFKIPKKQNSV